MARPRSTARIHLLAAKKAPVVIILRRKPTRTWHVLKWNLLTDELTPGTWFQGKIYPMRCDLSWDGRFMSYFAMGGGGTGKVWSGVCEPPFLRTVVHWPNTSTFNGGSVWLREDTAYRNLLWLDEIPEDLDAWPDSKLKGYLHTKRKEHSMVWASPEWQSRFKIRTLRSGTGEDFSSLFQRLHRDGWRPAVDGRPGPEVFDEEGGWIGATKFSEAVKIESGWIWKPTKRHPALRLRYLGYRSGSPALWMGASKRQPELLVEESLLDGRTGYILGFDLPDLPGVLGPHVNWATWTSTGELIYTHGGAVYRNTLDRLRKELPPQCMDLENLTPPK
jgi:hypothetical protein